MSDTSRGNRYGRQGGGWVPPDRDAAERAELAMAKWRADQAADLAHDEPAQLDLFDPEPA
jgi:hypothetical protein